MQTSLPPLNGSVQARIQRRAQAVARLRHPNLVRMLPLPGGAGLSPVLGEARRLSDFTLPAGTFKRFDLEQVVRLLLDVLSGLAALHEVVTDDSAFVHGDVAPHHIYIDEHGTARLVPLLRAHLSPGVEHDTSGYAAPERLAGHALDARADVFSVGVMLWEALAGERMFPEPSLEGMKARLARPSTIRLSARDRWAYPLCAIAAHATAIHPDRRFPNAIAFSNAIATAVAKQLSRVDTDAWQEEAPTPVFQPRVHLPTLRAVTPPPSVITLAPPEELPANEPLASAPTPAAARAPRAQARSGRAWLVALAGLVIVSGAVAYRRVPRAWQELAPARFAAAWGAPPSAPGLAHGASVEPRAPVAPPAPSLPSSQPASASSVVSPAVASAPIEASSAFPRPPVSRPVVTRPSSSSGPAAPAVPKPPAKPRHNDYGI